MASAVSVRSTYFAVRQEGVGGDEGDRDPEGKLPPNLIWWGLAAMPVSFTAITLVAGWVFALAALVLVLVVLGLVLAFGL